jgi:hypothetical protein
VRRILCEAANAASRTRSALAELFKSLLIRRGRKRAIFALAHKILKIVFVLISRGDYYRDATVDYETMSVEPNAPRQARRWPAAHNLRGLDASPLSHLGRRLRPSPISFF